MEISTVSLFGHREVNNLRRLESELYRNLRDLMEKNLFVSFLIGRNGEFDECAASVIKRLQAEVGSERCEINLVLPYTVANMDLYERYYDSIIIPEQVCGMYPKSAIAARNRWMVEKSDVVVTLICQECGGAFSAFKYAESLNKRTIRISF